MQKQEYKQNNLLKTVAASMQDKDKFFLKNVEATASIRLEAFLQK
jgi:hypothetical protein